MTTITVLHTETIHHGESKSSCPCGCGFSSKDKHATRLQVMEIVNRDADCYHVLDVGTSIDGGRSFGPGGWQPIDHVEGMGYARRSAEARNATATLAFLATL